MARLWYRRLNYAGQGWRVCDVVKTTIVVLATILVSVGGVGGVLLLAWNLATQ